ncbi:MAG: hypothetical protein KDK41_16785 [Leptospiraceae bacterium]|nr:hypothetical protein [Leptospiraceae bacterium]
MSSGTAINLEAAFRAAKEKNPHAYPRAIAAELGVGEVDILPFASVGNVRKLSCDSMGLLQLLTRCGKIKMMVRNDFAVLEMFGEVTLATGNDQFELQWSKGVIKISANYPWRIYQVDPGMQKSNEQSDAEGKVSLQWYSARGDAFLKVFIPLEVWQTAQNLHGSGAGPAQKNPSTVFAEQPDIVFSEAVHVKAAREMLDQAGLTYKKIGLSVLLREGEGRVAAEILHSPEKIVDARGWFNILDADFNLHLKEEEIDSALCFVIDENRKAVRVKSKDQYLDVFQK